MFLRSVFYSARVRAKHAKLVPSPRQCDELAHVAGATRSSDWPDRSRSSTVDGSSLVSRERLATPRPRRERYNTGRRPSQRQTPTPDALSHVKHCPTSSTGKSRLRGDGRAPPPASRYDIFHAWLRECSSFSRTAASTTGNRRHAQPTLAVATGLLASRARTAATAGMRSTSVAL